MTDQHKQLIEQAEKAGNQKNFSNMDFHNGYEKGFSEGAQYVIDHLSDFNLFTHQQFIQLITEYIGASNFSNAYAAAANTRVWLEERLKKEIVVFGREEVADLLAQYMSEPNTHHGYYSNYVAKDWLDNHLKK